MSNATRSGRLWTLTLVTATPAGCSRAAAAGRTAQTQKPPSWPAAPCRRPLLRRPPPPPRRALAGRPGCCAAPPPRMALETHKYICLLCNIQLKIKTALTCVREAKEAVHIFPFTLTPAGQRATPNPPTTPKLTHHTQSCRRIPSRFPDRPPTFPGGRTDSLPGEREGEQRISGRSKSRQIREDEGGEMKQCCCARTWMHSHTQRGTGRIR